jgi:hypothetical protein
VRAVQRNAATPSSHAAALATRWQLSDDGRRCRDDFRRNDGARDVEDARLFVERDGRCAELADDQEIGIRIRKGAMPSEELFHVGQDAVIYDSKRGTIAAHGHFTSGVIELDPPKYGCHLAIMFRARAAVPSSQDAPSLHDVLPGFDTRQKSYRKLTVDQYELLRNAIDQHPAVKRHGNV